MAWYEDEQFWRDLYPYMFSKERFQNAQEEVEKILGMADLQAGAVLDMASGPGRHAVQLAKKGFIVTGVDKSAFLLEKARRLAQEEEVAVDWVEADMRSYVEKERFDLALNLFSSFGFFDNEAEDRLVLHNLFTSLKKGGVIVLDTVGKEILARNFRSTISHRYDDGALLVNRHEVVDDWRRIRNEWLLIKEEKIRRYTFHFRCYSAKELVMLLGSVGFRQTEGFGSLDMTPYDDKAKRLVVVARKP